MSDITEKTELVIEILHYAQEHNLDIKDKADIKKVLNAIGSIQPEEEIEELLNLVQDIDTFIDISGKQIASEKTNLPN